MEENETVAPQGENEVVGSEVGEGEAVAPEGAVPPENTESDAPAA